MKRSVGVIAMLAAVAVACGSTSRALAAAPSRPASERAPAGETHALPPFRQIVVDGAAEVTLVQASSESIAIEAPGQSIVHAEVRDGVLAIRATDERHWWSYLLGAARRTPSITVSFRDLDSLRAAGTVKLAADGLRADALTLRFSGAATVDLTGLEARTLSIEGSGAVKADIAGRVGAQTVTISGAGDYRAGDLVSERASISVSGAGRVLVNAQKTLDVELSGAGKVDYKGNPKITQRVSGAGRVRRYESATHLMPLAAVSAASTCPRAACPA